MSDKTRSKNKKTGVGMAYSENNKSLISPIKKKKLRQTLLKRKLKNELLRSSSKAYTRTGRIGGKGKKTYKKNKGRKNKTQRGGMPIVVHNLFDGIGFLGSSFVNTLKGVPVGNIPLPFLGHFA